MSVKEALQWLKGKKVALCEPNSEKYQALASLLKNYGLVVSAFNTPEAVLSEIHRQQYSTLRVFLVILVDYELARAAEAEWIMATGENPTILQTPVVLMRTPAQATLALSLVEKGYFKFQLDSPVKSKALLKVLTTLELWKAWEAEMEQHPVRPLAVLE